MSHYHTHSCASTVSTVSAGVSPTYLNLGSGASSQVLQEEYTATGGENSYALRLFTAKKRHDVAIFRNGIRQYGDAYSIPNQDSVIVFTDTMVAGDRFLFQQLQIGLYSNTGGAGASDGEVVASSSEPANPSEGQLWRDVGSPDGATYIRTEGQWVKIATWDQLAAGNDGNVVMNAGYF